jgi:hypothetical protein
MKTLLLTDIKKSDVSRKTRSQSYIWVDPHTNSRTGETSMFAVIEGRNLIGIRCAYASCKLPNRAIEFVNMTETVNSCFHQLENLYMSESIQFLKSKLNAAELKYLDELSERGVEL